MKTEFEEINVILIDDHPIFRDGIQSLLASVRGIRVVAVASEGNEALEKIKEYSPDIVLLDLSLQGMSGFELLDIINQKWPDLNVLVLSMHIEEEYILRTVRMSVKGYLPKQNTDRDELVKAIKTIHRGKEYFSEHIQEMVTHFRHRQDQHDKFYLPEYENLTKREKEIVRLIVEGLSNQEIAAKLFLSLRTVETHKNNIMHKLNLRNTVELVKFAIKHNLMQI